jgi:hypothetical protein
MSVLDVPNLACSKTKVTEMSKSIPKNMRHMDGTLRRYLAIHSDQSEVRESCDMPTRMMLLEMG